MFSGPRYPDPGLHYITTFHLTPLSTTISSLSTHLTSLSIKHKSLPTTSILTTTTTIFLTSANLTIEPTKSAFEKLLQGSFSLITSWRCSHCIVIHFKDTEDGLQKEWVKEVEMKICGDGVDCVEVEREIDEESGQPVVTWWASGMVGARIWRDFMDMEDGFVEGYRIGSL